MVNSVESGVVIEFLEELFECEGFQLTLLSDNGIQFTSLVMEEFLSSRGINHKKVPSTKQWCGGKVCQGS